MPCCENKNKTWIIVLALILLYVLYCDFDLCNIFVEMAQRVKDFVAITQNCDCEILLKSGKYVVDAKSILGIFSLDLSKPLTVEIYSDDCADILEKLAKFAK